MQPTHWKSVCDLNGVIVGKHISKTASKSYFDIVKMASLLNFEEPSVDGALALFKAIENKFPHKTVGDNKWYLVVVCLHILVTNTYIMQHNN